MAALTRLPAMTRVAARLLALQASWNYECMQGIGFAHAAEPALRMLEGGRGGEAYRAALARQARFFNAHPYFASLAVGAAVRAEFDGVPPERIARLREALCGPLGAIGDRLFWASWLPTCAAIGLVAYAFGARAWAAVLLLVLYNAVHVMVRVWGLSAGWARGVNVVTALQAPALRTLQPLAAPLAAFSVGAAVPIMLAHQLEGVPDRIVAFTAALAVLLALGLRRAGAHADGTALATLILGLAWAVELLWS